MPHYTGREHPATDERRAALRALTEEAIEAGSYGDPGPEGTRTTLPWDREPAADTAPQTVVTEEVARVPRHRGQPKRGFRWGVFLIWLAVAGVMLAWLVIVYQLGAHNASRRPSPAVTVTRRPLSRPGPTTTVRVPGPARVVTRHHTVTSRATVTRTVTATPTTTAETSDPGGIDKQSQP